MFKAYYHGLSLIGRVFLAVTLALLIAGVLMLHVSSQQDAKSARAALEHQLAAEMAVLPGTLVEFILSGDFSTVRQILGRYVQRENLLLVSYQTTTGIELAGTNPAAPAQAPEWFASWMNLQNVSGEVPLNIGGRLYGKLHVDLAAQPAINASWSRLISYLTILGFAMLLTVAGIWVILKTGLSPLTSLQDGAVRLAAGETDVRITPAGSPELRHLTEAFNAMADSIVAAQMRLYEEAERLQVTLGSIGDGVIASNADGQVEFINPIASALTGWTNTEAIGHHVEDVFHLVKGAEHGLANVPVVSGVLQGLRNGVPEAGFAELVAREGKAFSVYYSIAPIRHSDRKITGSVLVFRDQTEAIEKEHQLKELNASLEDRVKHRTRDLQKVNADLQKMLQTLRETQNQLVQSEKMASLGSLVAGISHEINTPVGIGVTAASSIHEHVVQLRTEFVAGAMKRSTLEDFLSHVETGIEILMQNLKRAAELIRSFKQVAVDQTSGESRQINLSTYVDEVLRSLHPKFQGFNIEVVNDCAQDINILIMPGVIYQILSNLIVNSLVHAYLPGQTGTIRISAIREGTDIVLIYSDDGKGMSESDVKRIFDPFFTTRRGQGGSGLGMNIVYNLIHDALQGQIDIKSAPEQGVLFTIKFPETQV